MLTVGIIGAGPLGRNLALVAARAEIRVFLEDVMPSALHHAKEYIRQELNPSAVEDGRSLVRFVSSVEDAVREADLVIDCVPDELESKLEILWLLDRMSPPRTVIATPTTQLSISDLAGCTCRSEKCVALAIDARELSRLSPGIVVRVTPRTSADSVALVERFWRKLGVEPRFDMEVGGRRAEAENPKRPAV